MKTLKSGEIDYDHFREVLTINNSRPAIVNVNCGTTVKGAVDDLDRVLAILQECGYSEDRFYIHVDGALFGMMVSTSAGSMSSHAYPCLQLKVTYVAGLGNCHSAAMQMERPANRGTVQCSCAGLQVLIGYCAGLRILLRAGQLCDLC